MPIANPTSAFFNASASAIEDPAIPIRPPFCLIPHTTNNRSSGVALAITRKFFFTLSNFDLSEKSILYSFN